MVVASTLIYDDHEARVRPRWATAYVASDGPATDDDVSITNDGRRLGTAEAVIEFFEELRREQKKSEQVS